MTESAWSEIMRFVRAAPYPVQVLPADPQRARRCLAQLNVTERSWLGAITVNSGGLAIDHGWLRVLGSGTPQLPDIVEASKPEHGLVMVAYDVMGGHFIWAASEPDAKPTIHYFGPDTMDYHDLGLGYTDWLHSMLTGSMTKFYQNLRWHGWEAEVAATQMDEGIHADPPPSTEEGKDLNRAQRNRVDLQELVAYYGGLDDNS